MPFSKEEQMAIEKIKQSAKDNNIDITGGKIRRTSSRFCLGVEHGDYNGTELFGVGTDRFIWMGYKPNGTNRTKLFSANFPEDGVVEFELGKVPQPWSAEIADTWARFPYGVDFILRREGYVLTDGIDAVIYSNIPSGGMSRSASLSLNLILSVLEVNDLSVEDKMQIVRMAQAVENDYIGSPCGWLDQIMILFAKAGMGTHYDPVKRSVEHLALGDGADEFRIVVMDTGTIRPGLENSTYKIRRAECDQLVSLAEEADFDIEFLAEISDEKMYGEIFEKFHNDYPDLCDRMKYIFGAQQRFYKMLEAWKTGDIKTVGEVFRTDGIGLRDDYKISGPELEKMCDIARSVPGVLGERMLGGGDKGAAGALVSADSVEALKQAIDAAYPQAYPEYADKYAVHTCKLVDGVSVIDGAL